MKRLVFVCILFFSGTSIEIQAEEIDFYVGQGHDDWAFEVTGKGRALAGSTLVYVTFDNLKITNNRKHGKNKLLKAISIGFGYLNASGRWDVMHAPDGQLVTERTTRPGELATYKDLDAVLRLKDESPEKYWVVITVLMENGSTVYAHSRRDIFK